jgi:hypothetical protein
MHPLNPTRPTELTAALMENELLRYEVRHLQGRLSAATKSFPPTGEEIAAARRATKQPAKQPAKQDSGVALRNQQAYDDMVWLVGRLDGSPAGVLLRRWEGFRSLRARYLGSPGR